MFELIVAQSLRMLKGYTLREQRPGATLNAICSYGPTLILLSCQNPLRSCFERGLEAIPYVPGSSNPQSTSFESPNKYL